MSSLSMSSLSTKIRLLLLRVVLFGIICRFVLVHPSTVGGTCREGRTSVPPRSSPSSSARGGSGGGGGGGGGDSGRQLGTNSTPATTTSASTARSRDSSDDQIRHCEDFDHDSVDVELFSDDDHSSRTTTAAACVKMFQRQQIIRGGGAGGVDVDDRIASTEISANQSSVKQERKVEESDDVGADDQAVVSELDGGSTENNDSNKNTKERKRFFNHIARVSTLLLRREKDAKLLRDGHNITDDDDEDDDDDDDVVVDDEVTLQSDLTRPGRFVHIVTTASLPWFTGTAVNPLLRAAYLHERLELVNAAAAHNNVSVSSSPIHGSGKKNMTSWVTLVIPWLELPEDQQKLYHGRVFETPAEQEQYVRSWLRDDADMPDAAKNLNIVFYNARYHEGLGSVFAMGDIIQQLPQDELDVCVLEEPEQ